MSLALVSTVPITPKSDEVEIGVTVNLPFSAGFNGGEIPNYQFGDLAKRLDEMMRNDGHMRSLYRLMTLPFRRAKYRIVGDAGADEQVAFIEQNLSSPSFRGGMSTTMDNIRAQASRAFLMGFSAFEQVHQYVDTEMGPRWTLRKLAHRPQETITFMVDEYDGGFNGFKQRAIRAGKSETLIIPKERAFFFNVDQEEDQFYGRSFFLPALYHWDKKFRLYYLLHLAAQFGAVPGRIGYEEAILTTGQKKEFRENLAAFGTNTAMVAPRGTRIEPFAGDTSSMAGILSGIEHHNIQSSQSVLGQFIDLGVGSKTGSFALSTDSSDMFLMCQEANLNRFADHMSMYVLPTLSQWNFPKPTYPRMVFDPLADDLRQAATEIFKAISTSTAMHSSPEFLFELERSISEQLGLDIDYEKLKVAQQAAMDAARQAQAAAQFAIPNPPTKPGAPVKAKAGAIELADNVSVLTRFAPLGELKLNDISPFITQAKKALAGIGEYKSEVTDLFDKTLIDALKVFQKSRGLVVTGRLDIVTFATLLNHK